MDSFKKPLIVIFYVPAVSANNVTNDCQIDQCDVENAITTQQNDVMLSEGRYVTKLTIEINNKLIKAPVQGI